MNVGFLHVGTDPTLPQIMVDSVKRNMPGVGIMQMTDETTPAVAGVDIVKRMPYDDGRLMTFRLEHLADLPNGYWLILDTDVIVQRDVSWVMHAICPAKIALTRRTGVILGPGGVNIVELMPFNTGVMFAKDTEFFKRAAAYCRTLPDHQQRWWGDQLSVKHVVDQGFHIAELSCADFNYSPDREDEDVSKRAIIHLKGNRKEWMKSMAERIMRA
jgi:hypothetical protein